MNYYEHHIGDFLKKTAHLSPLEDGIYRRLLDRYYIAERSLPADVRECCKLARAVTKPERDAVASVLREFFRLDADGHHQKRADEEIARFKDKQAKAKRSADARWNAQRSQSEGNANAYANASPDDMRTHSEGNATRARPQSPVTRPNNQKGARASTSEAVAREGAAEPEGQQPTAAGLACRAMRQAGLQAVNPGDPRLLALLAQGVTVDELTGIAAEAVGKSKGWAWVLAVVQSRRSEAAAIALSPAMPSTPPSRDADRTEAYLREQFRPPTPEEKAKADEARKRAMAAVTATRGAA